MSLDQTHYDVAIFSTGLTQSILSAALAAAGLSVIHIDKNDYYADQWASLTLSELLKWTENASSSVDDVQLSFPSRITHRWTQARRVLEAARIASLFGPTLRHLARTDLAFRNGTIH